VLLIGNSQLGYFGNTPQPPDVTLALDDVSTLAFNGDHRLLVERVQREGTGCSGFVSEGDGPGTPLGEAANPDFDVVVLLPAIGENSGNAPCWEQFRDAAEGAGNRFAMMATAHVSSAYPSGFDTLDDAIRTYSAEHALTFIPAGETWRRVLGDAPTRDALLAMYNPDLAHPGPEGSYLYILALYGALTGTSVANAGIDNDIQALRCLPDSPCLSEDEMRGCLNSRGEWQCAAGNGVVFTNGKVHFVTDDEAALYQGVVDDVLAER
jgi:hypothetical protein